jgi:hypothetical protein
MGTQIKRAWCVCQNVGSSYLLSCVFRQYSASGLLAEQQSCTPDVKMTPVSPTLAFRRCNAALISATSSGTYSKRTMSTPWLCSSCASHGVLLSCIAPDSISSPMTRAAEPSEFCCGCARVAKVRTTCTSTGILRGQTHGHAVCMNTLALVPCPAELWFKQLACRNVARAYVSSTMVQCCSATSSRCDVGDHTCG